MKIKSKIDDWEIILKTYSLRIEGKVIIKYDKIKLVYCFYRLSDANYFYNQAIETRLKQGIEKKEGE